MPSYAPDTNAAETAKLWNKMLRIEAYQGSVFKYLIGKDENSFIQRVPDLEKSGGDTVYTHLMRPLTGRGTTGDQVLLGQEEPLAVYRDAVVIDEIRHATAYKEGIAIQRAPFDILKPYQRAISGWWADRLSAAGLAQLGGDTVQTDLAYTGNNATVAPDSDHLVLSGAANEGALTGGNEFTLQCIDRAEARATSKTGPSGAKMVPIRPGKVRLPGGVEDEGYVCIIDPAQWFALRNSTSAIGWPEYIKAFYRSSKKDNPILDSGIGLTQVMGKYSNTWIIVDSRLPQAISAGAYVANTRRAVFLGAQAATLAYGLKTAKGADTREEVEMIEDRVDYGKVNGLGVSAIYGLKKSTYGTGSGGASQDFAVITIPTYAPSPA